jgi:tRNA-dihydrouridine synthase B
MNFLGKIFLAPMAGVTETVFRGLCRENGVDIVVSEMISAEGVTRDSKKSRDLCAFKESERPMGIQIFGCDPSRLADCAAFIEEHYRPDFIDLNSGCPVPKVNKKNGGASLLRDALLFKKIVSGMVRSVSTPITVKLRSAWSAQDYVDVQFANIAQDCGASAVILHPRSKTMGFSGHSLWERIAIVKSSISIPVIGNGDILSAKDAQAMFKQTNCDSIMIGRAALGNPWIFDEIKRFLTGEKTEIPSVNNRKAVIFDHVRRFFVEYGEKKTVSDLKKHISWYLKNQPKASALRNSVFRANTISELEEIINSGFL